MNRSYILVGVVLISCACAVVAQNRVARCFQFTWLGPRFNNESIFMNATCNEATRLSEQIPCRMPLVVSEDGTWPNTQYIWENYRTAATCEPAVNDVCAQFTYYFNGVVDNSTYMCTRGVDANGTAINRGCFEQREGSFVRRVCFCSSVEGAIPCNDASLSLLSTIAFLLSTAIALKSAFTNK